MKTIHRRTVAVSLLSDIPASVKAGERIIYIHFSYPKKFEVLVEWEEGVEDSPPCVISEVSER